MRTRRLAVRLLIAAAVLASVGGCDDFAPVAATRAPSSPGISRVQSTHELPTPVPPPSVVGSASPVRAIERFAEIYINWTARDVAVRMARLAHDSTGQASSELALAAADAQGDSTLRRGGIENRGTVEAVTPRSAHRDEYLVITRESTVATNSSAYQGLAPAWHLTIATVVAVRASDWVISGWQPET